ncbi:hypothetical protein K503DRAFT_367496 [Rhizopogon vinicolor AM-OR11-026]|uniref:Uncharacterized protein n=1 Tax=Rhizopogon vinicolor AM-OR11-026 TaxID=1314800 RepID=A0A1B7MSC8_9AGAM|nr:hypothetical protein K503DRAFT_367496 [Rhizopogon vinicolor AM-OR11-026]
MPRRTVPPDREEEIEEVEEVDESVNFEYSAAGASTVFMSLRQEEAGHPRRTPLEGVAYPIPMRLVPSSASGQSVGVLRIGWVPRVGPQTSYIPVPPPQDLSQPMPLARSSHSYESDSYPRQAMFAAEHSSCALVRTRDFPYTNLPHFRSQDRVPSLFYPNRRRHMSQYELVSAPTGRRPASSVRHDLSSM